MTTPPPRPAEPMDLLATSTFGLESVVARELEHLGYQAKPIATGRVLFRGDPAGRAVCRANLWLRSADRVLIRVGEVPAADFDALFNGIKALPWERWIPRNGAFPVSGRCVRSQLSSEPAVQRATKRAIVERLMSAHGAAELPETGARVSVDVSILRDVATLTIDTSGAGLHKRGYREGNPGEAALKETLAAGLVLLSVWRPGRALVDPFCGSGTIAIEAAMIGRNMAPGLQRGFDAEGWGWIDTGIWREERESARGAAEPRLSPTIHASDVDERAIRIAQANARAAGVERDIHFGVRDVKDLSSKLDYGCVVTNPPYGVRLGEEREIAMLYRGLPRVFRLMPTWSFHILTGLLDLETIFGQPAARRRKLYNSKIKCTYFSFLGPKPPDMQRESWGGDEIDAPELPEDDIELIEGRQDAAPAGVEPPAASSAAASAERRESPPRAPAAPAFGGLRERDEKEAREFAASLANNLRHLRKYPSRGIPCYRVYERDVPDVPLIVDRYEERYHAAEYERQHSRTVAQQADWFDLMRRTIAQTADVPIEQVYMKEKHRQRGLTQHEKQGEARHVFVVSEGGLRFEVNLSDYIDTGLFLDHRLTRQMVREQAAGKRVLNLFCYTGAFTVYAAAGGARETTSVDLSNTYVDWAGRNLGLNGLAGPSHRLVRSDVKEFLLSQRARAQGLYDLAVVDPPTFSNSTSTEEDWEVLHGHVPLLTTLAPLMSPGGVVYFSTNFRRFKLDERSIAEAGLSSREISNRTVPPEYRNRRIHRCWRLQAVGKEEAVGALSRRVRDGRATHANETGSPE
ncbi:MAG: bifunctional 23S rRNA (guanine(2069)-N(7))-methyltransferase RlmK/23S rRNA (guanine(2445)-N(2))-methyltransferase RlmL [Phycisphaeraceae bacterium]|nr:bifunctional 23S rRNA (guanine(2069)-N(7))-methyltransferase RlmK/23S rRNA (guanine(2445)-N(2))-methyltransferase RlmL [Phycisphaeraceae bacterium]